jgi:predicted ATPase
LLKLAEPGGIVVSRTTHDMVSSLFDFESLGAHALQGIAESQHAWLVTGDLEIESHSEAIHLASELTPLVDRQAEIEGVLDMWLRAREGKGQAVLISGEAGIGKSRILRSVLERLRDETLSLLHFYGVQYFTQSVLYPIAKQLERDARMREGESIAERQQKLERLIEQQLGDIDRYMSWFCKLLSLPPPERYPEETTSPERQHEEIVAALIGRVSALAAQRPLIVVFEDLHWMDQASLEFINVLIENISNRSVLLLMTHRQSFDPNLRKSARLTSRSLRKLSRKDTKEQIMQVTGQKALPQGVLDHIVDTTDGNPLYIEEFTKSVLESDVLIEKGNAYEMTGSLQSMNLPNSLNDSLMARLDRLSADADTAKRYKEIAQTCAAIGRHFSFELLTAVSPYGDADLTSALQHLEDAALIFQDSPRAKRMYLFKHALVQEEAYRSIVKRNRRRLHIRIAEVLERRFPETRQNEPELIAHHYTEGGLPGNALPYLILAGEQAGQRAAHTQAVAHLNMSLRLLQDLPDGHDRDPSELNTQILRGLSLAASRGYGIPEVQSAYERARELCDRLDDISVENFPVIQSGLVTFYILSGPS